MNISRPLKRLTAATALAAAAALALGACDANEPMGAATYAPAAYGVQNGAVFDCYYIESPAEATSLVAAGLCPIHSVPTPMPLAWQETYWNYYDSPVYYNTYMPVSYRSTYTKVYVVHFSTKYKTQIAADSTKGTYKSSSGQKVTGTAAAKLKFTSTTGGTSKNVHGGGSARGAGSCSLSMTVVLDKGSSGSGTSHSGGSARTGSGSTGSKTGTTKTGTTKTGTGTGAHGGC